MTITVTAYVGALKSLKANYLKLPLYKRLWFNFWSYRLASTLSEISLENPSLDQMNTLLRIAKKSWFFKSIFGLLDTFKETLFKDELQHTPPAFKFELGKYLTTNELSALSQSLKTYVRLFQPVLDVRKFLHHVTYGKYDAVEAMLKKDNTLMTQRGAVTDRSGRFFTNISGFEYALWALNKHMWTRMLQCLPHVGQRRKLPLLAQYEGIKYSGITYTHKDNRRITNEKHIDFFRSHGFMSPSERIGTLEDLFPGYLKRPGPMIINFNDIKAFYDVKLNDF